MRRATFMGTALVLVALGACGGSAQPDAEEASAGSRTASESGLSGGREIAFTRVAGTREDRLADIILIDANGKRKLRLTDGPNADSVPAWSPDGKQIAFSRQAAGGGSTRIWVIDASGEKRLTRGPDIMDWAPAWSPDGERIAFARGHVESQGAASEGIYVIGTDGTAVTQLTESSDDSGPAWSPDGERIFFARRGDIWVMNSDGSAESKLTDGPDLRRIWASSPSVSPDGKRIAFSGRRERSEISRVWVMKSDGSDPAALKGKPRTDSGAPDWSPSGKRIVFAGLRVRDDALGRFDRLRFDRPGIYVMNSDGTDKRRLPGGRLGDSEAAWSPASD